MEAGRVTLNPNCQPGEDNSSNSSTSVTEAEPDNLDDFEEVPGSTQESNLVEIPDPTQQYDLGAIGSGYEDLKQDEAIAIVNAWLEEKPKVYGPNYNIEVARAHINYPGIVAIEEDIRRLAQNENDEYSPYHWKYDRPSAIGGVRNFEYLPSQGIAELVITVSEYKSFYTKGGERRSASKSGEVTRINKYTFGRMSDGTWKIADIECQESCD